MVATDTTEPRMRWKFYSLESGNGLIDFWKHHLGNSSRRVLYVLGAGFDPRMCLGLEKLVRDAELRDFDVWLIEYDEGADSPSQAYRQRVRDNRDRLSRLLPSRKEPISKTVELRSIDGRRRIGSRRVAKLFSDVDEFAGYTDVIVDVSALPRGLYFPAIAALLDRLDAAERPQPTNLHVFAWDDATLDKAIRDQGIQDEAVYLFPFGADDREAVAHMPTVWIPLLGEGQEAQLRSIDEFVLDPNKEIVPVLPFPAYNPRRADNLLFAEYRQLLLEGLRVEPANFAYAAEQNPFAVYRQIMRIVRRYRQSFEPLGGVRFVLSALSSKLFSLGALLAAYEMKDDGIAVCIAHVECRGYDIADDAQVGGDLFGLWLKGELYES